MVVVVVVVVCVCVFHMNIVSFSVFFSFIFALFVLFSSCDPYE